MPIGIKNRFASLVAEHLHDRIRLGLPRQFQPDRRIDQFHVALPIFRSLFLWSTVSPLPTAHSRAAHSSARKTDAGPAVSPAPLVWIVHLALVRSRLRVVAFVAV